MMIERPFGGVFLCLRIIALQNILPKRNLFFKHRLPIWIKRQSARIAAPWENGLSGVFLQGNNDA